MTSYISVRHVLAAAILGLYFWFFFFFFPPLNFRRSWDSNSASCGLNDIFFLSSIHSSHSDTLIHQSMDPLPRQNSLHQARMHMRWPCSSPTEGCQDATGNRSNDGQPSFLWFWTKCSNGRHTCTDWVWCSLDQMKYDSICMDKSFRWGSTDTHGTKERGDTSQFGFKGRALFLSSNYRFPFHHWASWIWNPPIIIVLL